MKLNKILLPLILLFAFVAMAQAEMKGNWVKERPADVNLGTSLSTFVDLPATSTSSFVSVDITTQTLVDSGANYTLALASYTDIAICRNVVADFYFSTQESTTVISATLTITGKDQFGKSRTEALTMSTNSVTGSRAWSTITSMVISDATVTSAAADATVNLGIGTKIGIPNNVRASADIIKTVEDGSVSTTYTLSTTYDTIIFNSAPDGSKDYYVYNIDRSDKYIYKY